MDVGAWILLLQITSGTPDSGDPAVVALMQNGGVFCTGTMIAPRVVLTAAHCAFGADGVAVGAMPTARARAILDRRVHPAFDRVALVHDVGLLLLDGPVDAPPPLLLDTPMDASFVGRSLRLVGFGELLAGMPMFAQKRQGTTTIAAVDADSFSFGPAPSQTCAGDSGGPAFVTLEGTERLAGVASHGDAQCAAQAVDMRVDRVLGDFVAPYLAATAEGAAAVGARCFYADNCASGTCLSPPDGGFAYCTTACARPADCPAPMTCASNGLCIHWTPTPGASGASCASDDECRAGLCAREHTGELARCTRVCFADDPSSCAAGEHCAHAANRPVDACFSDGESAGGCAIVRGHDETKLGMLLLVMGVSCLTTRRHQNNFLRRLRIRHVTQRERTVRSV